MKDEKEKLEIKKKPQEVKKKDLDKVGGGWVPETNGGGSSCDKCIA